MVYDVAILGAGASGLMAAVHSKEQKICLIDSNKNIGAKIKISGGAKCNITNEYLSPLKYLGDHEKIQRVFDRFDNTQLLSFLNTHGVFPKVDPKIVKGTYFCSSSSDVISMFSRLTKKHHFFMEQKVLDVEYDKSIYTIVTHNKKIEAKKLIVASGGLSYKDLGASEIGFYIAKKFGHTINTPNPALVGLTVQKEQFWFKSLSGLSVEVRITIGEKRIEGKMLFTHKGCSGPAILSASLYWKKGTITIDFLPFKNSYLPKRLKKILNEYNINPKEYTFAPAGTFGYSKAEVTKGGVNLDEVDENLQSKFQKGLYFIGEVLDVTGELGGYNFQWAFSSGYCIKK